MQLQASFSGDGENWFLINACPDLRYQIEANPELQPSAALGKRNTPLHGILLTSADLDQVLGVLLLREFQPLTIYATSLVRKVLEANTFFRMLDRVPQQLTWVEISPDHPLLLDHEITCRAIPLSGSLPFYARDVNPAQDGQASLGLLLEASGLRIAYTPSLPKITEELLAIYSTSDVILVDGTFWSDAELSSTHAGTPSARSIGHIPMSGDDGIIALLSQIKKPKKVFVHINNTNPVLDPRSAEYNQVIQAGWEIGHDGWQLN
ncbi:Coenzyme PQQ synthesis protein B [Acidisarcina polymorpha]|uniref:Coenzyme PQQ synthesis protein B n=2 Tax=Acidisarcina polymorpha TaxID=2211140 RepID=A0A2Z5G637_9BACT|nr:Coenzyme PQQ synthesis protein B [Acidisarcina polymorpha]